MENNIEILKEVLKPLKALPSTPLADVGGTFDALELDDESPILDAPFKDLCE